MEKKGKRTKDNVVYVYVCKREKFSAFDNLPAFVEERISGLKEEVAKAQKRCVYGLLAYALQEAYAMSFSSSDVYLSNTGKPTAKDYYFSVSHTADVVAVAVSKTAVGIDVESKNREISKEVLLHILHKNERLNPSLPHSIALFTQKEAIFKMQGKEKTFIPKNIDTTKEKVKTVEISYGEEGYFLSISAEDFILYPPVVLS